MSTEKMREEFQEWWRHREQAELRSSCAMGWAFVIWQASRAAIEVELPERYDDGPWDGDGIVKTDGGLFVRVDDMTASIESLGLKIKQ